jgi:predicted nicotinamide N-methyase
LSWLLLHVYWCRRAEIGAQANLSRVPSVLHAASNWTLGAARTEQHMDRAGIPAAEASCAIPAEAAAAGEHPQPFVRSVRGATGRESSHGSGHQRKHAVAAVKMWDDTADMPFEQRFIAHRTIPVGPAALELEQAPPTLGGTDPLGTACTVWRGGERLVELLQARRELVAGKRVVELGSGTGIAGLACAAHGASRVVLTDLPENLPLLRRNATRNGWVQSLCGCEVSVEKLDWHTDALPACDVLLGADVCYHEAAVPALITLVDAAIAAGAAALLACERHEPVAYAAMTAALRRHAVDVLLRDDGGARRFEVLLVTAHPLAAPPETACHRPAVDWAAHWAHVVAAPDDGRLEAAWARGDRVESLQLVADEVQAMATAQDFVSAVRTLDTFGALVLGRLRDKAADPSATPTARATHGNWMSMVHALRLLAPRFYVESALLGCCEFGDEALDAVAARLARSARGFGDASRGAFARCYLAKCVLAAGADRGVLAALRDDVAGGDGPAVAWILEASGGGAPV